MSEPTILDRAAFTQQLTVSDTPKPLELPGGQIVLVKPVGSKLFREYRKSLRDEDGKVIEARKDFVDELLVARCLVNPDGSRMFTDEDVLAGMLDGIRPAAMDTLLEFAWGQVSEGGDREKKS